MQTKLAGLVIATTSLLTGCAGLDFGDEGLAYYEPKPYLFVNVDADCKSTATVVSLPGTLKRVKFKPGMGSADVSLALSNGMLTNVGQKTDSKVPETIAAVASLGTAVSGNAKLTAEDKAAKCEPSAKIYAINNGIPDKNNAVDYPITLLPARPVDR